MPWTPLCQLDALPPTGGHYVEAAGRPLAVYRLPEGGVRVLDDVCPHAGASLAGGSLDAEMVDPPNTCVVCPWHGWAFDIETGVCPDNPAVKVRVYESRVVEGRVEAALG